MILNTKKKQKKYSEIFQNFFLMYVVKRDLLGQTIFENLDYILVVSKWVVGSGELQDICCTVDSNRIYCYCDLL